MKLFWEFESIIWLLPCARYVLIPQNSLVLGPYPTHKTSKGGEDGRKTLMATTTMDALGRRFRWLYICGFEGPREADSSRGAR
jgi:hypothetical protein